MLSTLVVAGSVTFLAASHVYDTTMTEKGLKVGVAVEKSSWLIGQKPSALALYLRDGLVGALVCAPSIISAFLGNTPLALGFCAGPVVYGVMHIRGGLSWKRLLK